MSFDSGGLWASLGRDVPVPLLALVAIGLTIVVLLLILWSVKRHPNIHMRFHDEHTLDELQRTIAGITFGTLHDGNLIEIVENGRFFDRVIDDIESARQSVTFETFLWKDGEVAARISEALSRKAREGVMVRLLVDARGGKGLGERSQELEDAGVVLARFHPVTPANIGRLNSRDHRKIVVVDGSVGWVGGHCVTDDWLGDAEDRKHFRDLSARVTGPVVHALQSAFSENWIETTGDAPTGEGFFPGLQREGESTAHVVFTTPAGSSSAVKILHHLAIHGAKRTIRLQNPYFLPDRDAIEALQDAAGRGVDVRIMLPSAGASDFPIVQHASHHKFGALLEGGVRIFEYEKTLLHQKTFAVDGSWGAIGSTNFDDRSFEINDEVTLSVFDPPFARALEEIFEADLEHCRELTLEEWKKRSVVHKLQDFSAFLFNEQL
jgi:cardiolipin synthase A/B